MEDRAIKMENEIETIDMESSFMQDIENEKDERSTKSVPNICTDQVKSDHDIVQPIPNVVHLENSVQEAESAKRTGAIKPNEAYELDVKKSEVKTNNVSPKKAEKIAQKLKTAQETDVTKTNEAYELDVKHEAKTNNVSPKTAGNIESVGWKRFAKVEPLKGGGKSIPLDDTQIAAPKSSNGTILERNESLDVPSQSAESSKVRRESTLSVSKVRKFSVLSPLSRRSIPFKTDFTTVQMPHDEKNSSVIQQEDSWIRVAIPYLPLWVAVLCLLLNILVAGTGTVISGLCILCCGKTRVPTKYDQDPVLLVCVNFWVGLAQLFTVTFMLVGWFWSIAWGIRMIVLSCMVLYFLLIGTCSQKYCVTILY